MKPSEKIDHKYREWGDRCPWTVPWPWDVPVSPEPYTIPFIKPYVPPVAPPTQAEIDDFRRLLERARKYDRENHEKDCEETEKKKKIKALIKALADELGIDISFVDEAA